MYILKEKKRSIIKQIFYIYVGVRWGNRAKTRANERPGRDGRVARDRKGWGGSIRRVYVRNKEEFALVEIQIAKTQENVPKNRHRDATVHVNVPPDPDAVRTNLEDEGRVSDCARRRREGAAHVPYPPFEIRP